MTLEQLGNRLGKTKQSVSSLEKREELGTVSINTIKEVAAVLDMQLVYGLVPKATSLEGYIEQRANELAREMVSSSNQQMKLEDQEVNDARVRLAVEELQREFVRTVDRRLWD